MRLWPRTRVIAKLTPCYSSVTKSPVLPKSVGFLYQSHLIYRNRIKVCKRGRAEGVPRVETKRWIRDREHCILHAVHYKTRGWKPLPPLHEKEASFELVSSPLFIVFKSF